MFHSGSAIAERAEASKEEGLPKSNHDFMNKINVICDHPKSVGFAAFCCIALDKTNRAMTMTLGF